jgi:hypothetical protein
MTEKNQSSCGSEGWAFDSLRARPGQRPLPILQWPSLLPIGFSACSEQLIDRIGRLLAKLGSVVAPVRTWRRSGFAAEQAQQADVVRGGGAGVDS